jgi:hypothetical protein
MEAITYDDIKRLIDSLPTTASHVRIMALPRSKWLFLSKNKAVNFTEEEIERAYKSGGYLGIMDDIQCYVQVPMPGFPRGV